MTGGAGEGQGGAGRDEWVTLRVAPTGLGARAYGGDDDLSLNPSPEWGGKGL